MKAIFITDKAKGAGFGFLAISDASNLTSVENISFCIKRASDQKNLGKSGWQPAEAFLQPSGVFLTEDGFGLSVGPDVVDTLDPQENYRLILQCADGSKLVSALRVPEVVYSQQTGGQGIGVTEKAAPPPPPPPPPPPLPPREETPPPPPVQEPEPATPPAPKKSLALPLVAVLAALLILGGGGFALWKFVLQPDTDTTAREAEAPPPAKSPLQQAREYLAGSGNPDEALSLAKRLRGEESGADAAFLLAEDAAEKGNTEAMLMTGSFYDPADSGPSGSIEKDPFQALEWYTKAKAAGNAEAAARLNALRSWAESEAAKGSQTGKDLLLKLPPS